MDSITTRYTNTTEQINQVRNSFIYHAPKEDQPQRYVILRDTAYGLAEMILEFVPPSPERTLAIRKLEESIMWANKAIACNEK